VRQKALPWHEELGPDGRERFAGCSGTEGAAESYGDCKDSGGYGLHETSLTGSPDALYERHLTFNAVGLPAAGARERFEAFASAVRDIRLHTKQVYEKENPKRVYYLSMEFLIGRSLANNITNLLLDPMVDQAVEHDGLDWRDLGDQEPDAGLGNGGLASP
jgi:starch phosphorylase